jgi:hypothetical protein
MSIALTPGKRGAYEIKFHMWSGWNPSENAIIELGDPIPPKPWLVNLLHVICSTGRGRDQVELTVFPSLFISHHALSRLAQRHGARTWRDLLDAAMEVLRAMADLAKELGLDECMKPPPAGWRVSMKSGAVVVLRRHEKWDALVAATVLPMVRGQ